MRSLKTMLLTFGFSIFGFFAHADTQDISPEDFLKLDEKQRFLLDVRTPREYSEGFIPTATNIPVGELSEQYSKIGDKDQQVVVYCRSGFRAARAISFLKDQGFTNVIHLDGDYSQWEEDNREISKP